MGRADIRRCVAQLGLKEVGGGVVHGCELVGPGEEKRAWSYAVERDGAVEVEELFVMPQFRRHGYGRHLLQAMGAAAEEIQATLRFWVTHADATPDNLVGVEKLLGDLCLRMRPSQERWASFSA